MVLHHVVSTEEFVLLLDGKAIPKEAGTEKDSVEELDRVFHQPASQEADKAFQQTNLTIVWSATTQSSDSRVFHSF